MSRHIFVLGILGVLLSGCTQQTNIGMTNSGSSTTANTKPETSANIVAVPSAPIAWPLRDKISSATTGAILKAASGQFEVKIADSDAERQQGLSGRETIGADGLLFVLEETKTPGIWMKDMRFAIDIVWLLDGKVVDVSKNAVPEPGVADTELTIYRPDQPVDAILEVVTGDAERFGLFEGVKVGVLEIQF